MENLVLNSVESVVKAPVKSDNQLVNVGKSLVNAGKSVVNAGKNVDINVKKLVIPYENRWKSSRNPFTERSRADFLRGLVGWGILAGSLYTTCVGMPLKIQLICYTSSASILMLIDPIKIFRCMLAKASRGIISFLFSVLVLCLIYSTPNTWKVFLVLLVLGCVSIYFKNDDWCKAESWNFSKEVEHALVMDSENKCYKSWQANGKANVKTLLYSLGVSVSESDLDVFMKSVYFVGFLNSLEYQKKYLQDEHQQEQVYLKAFQKENEELINDYNDLCDMYEEEQNKNKELIKKYNQLVMYAKKLKEQQEQQVKEVPAPAPAKENVIIEGITNEQYYQVIQMLDSGEYSQNQIEKITGISRHYIRKCIAYRNKSCLS